MSKRNDHDHEYEEDLEEVAQATVGNQNVLTFVIALLVFLLVIVGGLFLNKNGNSESSEADKLRQEIRDRQSRLGISTLGAESSHDIASRIQKDSITLASLSSTLETRVFTLETELAKSQQGNEYLTKEIARLQNELNAATANSSNAAGLQAQLDSLQGLLTSANAELNTLRSKPDLNNALTQAEAEAIRLRQQIAALENEIDKLKGQLVSSEDITALRKKNRELRRELQRLRAELDRNTLYVESETDLDLPAKKLFARLKQMEGITPEALTKEYSLLRDQLDARVVDRVTFATGSSSVDFEKEEGIRRAINDANSDSFFLVVGYASTTGAADINRELSAKRSTTSASVANLNRQPEQKVQAVYLGQTNRFSTNTPTENQICEIWEIQK